MPNSQAVKADKTSRRGVGTLRSWGPKRGTVREGVRIGTDQQEGGPPHCHLPSKRIKRVRRPCSPRVVPINNSRQPINRTINHTRRWFDNDRSFKQQQQQQQQQRQHPSPPSRLLIESGNSLAHRANTQPARPHPQREREIRTHTGRQRHRPLGKAQNPSLPSVGITLLPTARRFRHGHTQAITIRKRDEHTARSVTTKASFSFNQRFATVHQSPSRPKRTTDRPRFSLSKIRFSDWQKRVRLQLLRVKFVATEQGWKTIPKAGQREKAEFTTGTSTKAKSTNGARGRRQRHTTFSLPRNQGRSYRHHTLH